MIQNKANENNVRIKEEAAQLLAERLKATF